MCRLGMLTLPPAVLAAAGGRWRAGGGRGRAGGGQEEGEGGQEEGEGTYACGEHCSTRVGGLC